ncbi:MAG: glycosyltransferase family 2 protein [Desulfobacterales bacterium]|nr:glycosyltransferase family 2 protein [Desulfobacterales bacterium]
MFLIIEDLILNRATVIIVNFNGAKFIEKCLDSLNNQEFKAFSVIIVDNASSDNSVELIERKYKNFKLIKLDKNFGFAIANNIALKVVNTEYVALLNNDAVADKIWLKKLIETLDNNPSAAFAASKMLFFDNPKVIDRAGDAYTQAGTGSLRGRGLSYSCYNKKEWIFGACAGSALYRKKILDKIGLFDEDFFLLYEDVDLSFRFQLKGYKCIYVPDAFVYHKSSMSIGNDSWISVYYSHRNLEWTYIKNMPKNLLYRTIIPHIIYDFASFLYFLIKGKGFVFLKAKIDSIKGLNKILKKRRLIQKEKRVGDDYIWSLFQKEIFFDRLIRRIRKND